MKKFLCAGLLATGIAFAMDMDSIPVWNPSYLVGAPAPVSENSKSATKLETSGYKTMQVVVGDGGTQMDQELRLSIRGSLADSVFIDALLSDVDRKAGDQTTATLQEVDQIYFRVESPHWMLHLGDYSWRDESMGLMSFERSALGAMAGFRSGMTEVRGAVGTDESKRHVVTFSGVSGQREGYSISDVGEFISVVPQSEKVYFNGNLLKRDVDYVINYAGGLLSFGNDLVPGAYDEIRVEYDSYEDQQISRMYAAKGSFRHPNVHFDMSGCRLEDDVERLRRGTWDDDDYKQLKNDSGAPFERADSLGALKRPYQRMQGAARLQLQLWQRLYADMEVAMNREDSNMVSSEIKGPRGRGFRWFLSSDSSQALSYLPVALDVYGNYLEEGFWNTSMGGRDRDWNSYILRDEWDLDSSFGKGFIRHDDFALRLRLGSNWFSKLEWGYRQGEDELWNSSRSRFSLKNDNRIAINTLALTRVASFQDWSRTRYQGTLSTQFKTGFVRPFGSMDLRYTEADSSHLENQNIFGKAILGSEFVFNRWNFRESFATRNAKHRGDSFDADHWEDSISVMTWQQSATVRLEDFALSHLLQYERSEQNSAGAENTWTGDLNARYTSPGNAFISEVEYKMGMTSEQTYTPIYKAVAKGTGDVLYDSLSGTFIEGVDNGDFVYEGMGRNDSIGPVLASNASFMGHAEWNPGLAFDIRRGFLRDITLAADWDGESEDTTGKKLFFPAPLPSVLKEYSSGTLKWETSVQWIHPLGAGLIYALGSDYEKKLSSFDYFEETFYHSAQASYLLHGIHYWVANYRWEESSLTALQKMNWHVWDLDLKYRWTFLEDFHVEPGARYRTGDGAYDSGDEFDANLWEASLRFGYLKYNEADCFAKFSVISVDTDDLLPYRMMSGYSDGITYRLELSASVQINQYLSLGGHYILRFGDAEENVFQKLTTEAKAFF